MTRVELNHAVSAGIELRIAGTDMIPLFEEHSARLESNNTLKQWEALDMMEKALIVAQRRIKFALENIQSEAQINHAKRNAGRK